MGKAMANDFVEFMECDPDMYSLLLTKFEQFLMDNNVKLDADLEADLCQAVMENISLTN